MDNNSVKENISKIRKASGLSQSETADKLGISRTAYRNIEKGETRLISENVDRIATLFETTAEELVLGYLPSGNAAERLKDIQEEYSSTLRKQQDEYEVKISALNENIATLTGYVESLKDNIRLRDEIISMLKKKLGENAANE